MDVFITQTAVYNLNATIPMIYFQFFGRIINILIQPIRMRNALLDLSA